MALTFFPFIFGGMDVTTSSTTPPSRSAASVPRRVSLVEGAQVAHAVSRAGAAAEEQTDAAVAPFACRQGRHGSGRFGISLGKVEESREDQFFKGAVIFAITYYRSIKNRFCLLRSHLEGL